MKRLLLVTVPVALVIAMGAGLALAQMGRGPTGPMMGGPGQGMMGGVGPGMMGRPTADCPGMAATEGTESITEEKAKELAQAYADRHLPGFTVERVLPFTGMRGTMYSVELKGPNDGARTFHVNPWGSVMPFGGPWRRAG